MNRKKTLSLASLLVFSFFLSACRPPATETAPGEKSPPSASKTTLKSLLSSGQSQKCTWNMSDGGENVSGQGTAYLSGGKYRMDMAVNPSGESAMETHIVSDGTWFYQWNSASPDGTKMKLEDMKAMGGDTQPSAENLRGEIYSPPNLDREFDYRCSAWSADPGLFVPPGDVNFRDIGLMIQKARQVGKDMAKDVCAACDGLPENARKDCLQSCSQ